MVPVLRKQRLIPGAAKLELSGPISKTKVDVSLRHKVVLWLPCALHWPGYTQHCLGIVLTLKVVNGRLYETATLGLKNQKRKENKTKTPQRGLKR